MQNTYTDLAYERHKATPRLPGCHYEETALGLCRLHTLRIETAESAHAMRCEAGTYHTLFFPPITTAGEEEIEEIVGHLSSLLAQLANRQSHGTKGRRILVAALGNRHMTADAVGPCAADEICATAHLKETRPDLLSRLQCAEIAVITPGASAQSGMESAALIAAAADRFCPHLAIAIDALAARAAERLSTTIQISDTGISPGAGIGNPRAAISCKALGCPVISIGAPTVVHAATLACDLLEQIHGEATESTRTQLYTAAGDFFVCPRDADIITARYATVIARAVNRTFGVPHL